MSELSTPAGATVPAPDDVKRPNRPRLLDVMGPGLITGASDDDPSGIATYSQAGAQFGYSLGWTLLFTYPLMCAIQLIAAQIGRVTGRGLAGNMRRHCPKWLVYSAILLLLVANVINIGADLGAMGAAVNLLVGGPVLLYVAVFALVTVLLEVFLRYSRYVTVLKWLTLSLFAYVGTVFVVGVHWGSVVSGMLVPRVAFNSDTLTMIVAILGTTISPYLFFWQAEEEVEDERERPEAKPLRYAPDQAPQELERMRLDTLVGMGFSNLVALFIVITAAATLNATGHTDIQTSSQAAEALRPIAGPYTFYVFAAGIIGTGLLALPVLAGSAAYAVGEAMRWRVGLSEVPGKAKAFYTVIAVATAIGAGLNFTPLDPIKALILSAVVNGVVAVPVMVSMMVLATRREVMGSFVLSRPLKVLGWVATVVMLLAAIGMFATLGN